MTQDIGAKRSGGDKDRINSPPVSFPCALRYRTYHTVVASLIHYLLLPVAYVFTVFKRRESAKTPRDGRASRLKVVLRVYAIPSPGISSTSAHHECTHRMAGS